MTDLQKQLEKIIDEASDEIGVFGCRPVIRAALDKAIEVVLTAEPSERVIAAGRNATLMPLGVTITLPVYRAMSSALLEEIKNETPGS